MNIACGERISLNTLLASLAETAGEDVDAEHLPARPGDVPHSLADISKARELIGYEPRVSVARRARRNLRALPRARAGVVIQG